MNSTRSGILPSPVWAGPLPFLPTLHPLQLVRAYLANVEHDGPEKQNGEHHRERATESPVTRLEELLLDQVPHHHRPGSSEQVRNDELASRRYEDQDAPGYDARHAQRERHPPEGVPAARPEVLRGLLQADVELLEGRIERQHHKRQV